MKLTLLFFGGLALLAAGDEKPTVRGHVFAWPFLEAEEMQPRGGSTQGAEVTLDTASFREWSEFENELSDYQKDVRAIFGMAGEYRVSFDFMETMGFRDHYVPPKPYFSWGTEHVAVIAHDNAFISLQHTLVMFFKDQEGKELGPMVMKHWRQDWTYQDTDLHTYRGDSKWQHESRKKKEMEGKWTQAVYQVDDSPRYEVVGDWNHDGGVSTWLSENCARPLPRREFSVRNDYNVLEGTHEITMTPTGWVHVQNNRKVSLSPAGERKIVGHELGVNRYERISSPSLGAADESWSKTAPYWEEVRKMWREVYQQDEFSLKSKVDGKKLYEEHFAFAAEVEKSGYDAKKGREHARETIQKFLIKPSKDSKEKSAKY